MAREEQASAHLRVVKQELQDLESGACQQRPSGMMSPPLLLEAQALLNSLANGELPQAAQKAMQGLKAAVAA
eukprot:4880139-Karenia_brevis.AAC.1